MGGGGAAQRSKNQGVFTGEKGEGELSIVTEVKEPGSVLR